MDTGDLADIYIFAYFQSSPGYSAFCDAALQHLKSQLTGAAFADGVVFTNADKPHEPGTKFIPWLTEYDRYIKCKY